MEFTPRFYFILFFFNDGPNPELFPNPPLHGSENKGREMGRLPGVEGPGGEGATRHTECSEKSNAKSHTSFILISKNRKQPIYREQKNFQISACSYNGITLSNKKENIATSNKSTVEMKDRPQITFM